MKIAFFSTKPFDREYFDHANKSLGHELHYFEPRLDENTAVMADGFPAVCGFVSDSFPREALQRLRDQGTEYILLRSAGFNHVDLEAADELGLKVARVPDYSPNGVAEHAVGLMLALNRKIHRANQRVHEGNFQLQGLMGFDMEGKTAGIVGTGKIGIAATRILAGFGCNLLGYDPYPNDECIELGMEYVELDDLLERCDIITLHAPLNPHTHHMINAEAVQKMKKGSMLINTSRGALVDTQAVIDGLKSGKIGYLGLDVYEEEGDLFFEDLSDQVIEDDVFARLMTFPNVIITAHQAFFTHEAVSNIARVTLQNASDFEQAGECENEVQPKKVKAKG